MKEIVKRIPVIGPVAKAIRQRLAAVTFPGSERYWIKRYADGKSSGPGSYNDLAMFKADTINNFIKANEINTVIEYGCGDGNQLRYVKCVKYLGFDVSPNAIALCERIFMGDLSKKFRLMRDYNNERADLTLS